MATVIAIEERRAREAARCQATTVAGKQCRNRAAPGSEFCRVHGKKQRVGPFDARSVENALAFLRRRLLGDYEIDEFGFDRELTETILAPLARFLHEKWFRVDWIGLENVPAEGPALLVSNHAGTVPVDAVIMKFGVLDRHPAHRHVRLLAADLAFRLPFIAPLARKSGNTLAGEEDSFRLLRNGELLGVFPEGYKGVGKHYRDRYKLQRFGRGGFIEVALRARVPIVPVSIVGAEEIYPKIGDIRPLARIMGAPYFPVTPFFPWLGPLGLIPLPSKWIIEFGEPIRTEEFAEDAWQDALFVFQQTDHVRDVIQQTLYRNVLARRSIFG
jgi:1-acyl-sn-glycerol-3-phosphate acyltransferase